MRQCRIAWQCATLVRLLIHHPLVPQTVIRKQEHLLTKTRTFDRVKPFWASMVRVRNEWLNVSYVKESKLTCDLPIVTERQ
jgi:hypothetical protein